MEGSWVHALSPTPNPQSQTKTLLAHHNRSHGPAGCVVTNRTPCVPRAPWLHLAPSGEGNRVEDQVPRRVLAGERSPRSGFGWRFGSFQGPGPQQDGTCREAAAQRLDSQPDRRTPTNIEVAV